MGPFANHNCARRNRRWVTAGVFAIFTALKMGAVVYAAMPTEYQIKAVFLFHFAQFVEWPAGAFPANDSPLCICILGRDPFGKDLDQTVQGQTVGSRVFSVRRITQVPRDNSCQIVFVSSSEEKRFGQIVAASGVLPILTVGEEEDFMSAQGIISLHVEDKKVRFEVNLDSAERAGLKISSKLLKLAKKVHERGKT